LRATAAGFPAAAPATTAPAAVVDLALLDVADGAEALLDGESNRRCQQSEFTTAFPGLAPNGIAAESTAEHATVRLPETGHSRIAGVSAVAAATAVRGAASAKSEVHEESAESSQSAPSFVRGVAAAEAAHAGRACLLVGVDLRPSALGRRFFRRATTELSDALPATTDGEIAWRDRCRINCTHGRAQRW